MWGQEEGVAMVGWVEEVWGGLGRGVKDRVGSEKEGLGRGMRGARGGGGLLSRGRRREGVRRLIKRERGGRMHVCMQSLVH